MSLEDNVSRFLHQFSDFTKNLMLYLVTILSFALWLVASRSQNGCSSSKYHVPTQLYSSQAGENLFLLVTVSSQECPNL